MNNFIYQNCTRLFSEGTETCVGQETIKYGNKVLLLYGGGSIKKTGLYDRVMQSLKDSGIEVTELAGVKPNPRLSLVKEGIDLCRKKNINFILAVGGGSVIDTAKAIGVGVPYDGDVWDFYMGTAEPQETIPVGVVLTIPAAGSEASNSSVIQRDGWLKFGLTSDVIRPVFAIMIRLTYADYQTVC